MKNIMKMIVIAIIISTTPFTTFAQIESTLSVQLGAIIPSSSPTNEISETLIGFGGVRASFFEVFNLSGAFAGISNGSGPGNTESGYFFDFNFDGLNMLDIRFPARPILAFGIMGYGTPEWQVWQGSYALGIEVALAEKVNLAALSHNIGSTWAFYSVTFLVELEGFKSRLPKKSNRYKHNNTNICPVKF